MCMRRRHSYLVSELELMIMMIMMIMTVSVGMIFAMMMIVMVTMKKKKKRTIPCRRKIPNMKVTFESTIYAPKHITFFVFF